FLERAGRCAVADLGHRETVQHAGGGPECPDPVRRLQRPLQQEGDPPQVRGRITARTAARIALRASAHRMLAPLLGASARAMLTRETLPAWQAGPVDPGAPAPGQRRTRVDDETIRRIEQATGQLATKSVARMDDELPWFRELPSDQRSWVTLVA